ncbi:MAG TPA: hypothetical protein V6D33_07395 [Cyanophyceae cyanobacterium]
MFKQIVATTLTVLTTLAIVSLPSHAQTNSNVPNSTQAPPDLDFARDLNRAKNLARMTAERANGGLGEYRAEASMHGPAFDAPYVDNNNGTWTFTFKGRNPYSTDYTIESVVTVTRDGSQVTMDYNGPIRTGAQ